MRHHIAELTLDREIGLGIEKFAAAEKGGASWEQLSAMAGTENARILGLVHNLDAAADRVVEQAQGEALKAALPMLQQALSHTDPEFHIDLYEGVNALVGMAVARASSGKSPPINFMDTRTRKAMFLAEAFVNAPKKESEEKID